MIRLRRAVIASLALIACDPFTAGEPWVNIRITPLVLGTDTVARVAYDTLGNPSRLRVTLLPLQDADTLDIVRSSGVTTGTCPSPGTETLLRLTGLRRDRGVPLAGAAGTDVQVHLQTTTVRAAAVVRSGTRMPVPSGFFGGTLEGEQWLAYVRGDVLIAGPRHTADAFTIRLTGALSPSHAFSGLFLQTCGSGLYSRTVTPAGQPLSITAAALTGTLLDTVRRTTPEQPVVSTRTLPLSWARR